MSARFAGKVAIVTGGASGIGAATVEGLYQEGAAVLIVDRQAELAEALAQRLDPAGQRARSLAVDVQHEASAQASVRAALDAWGRLDILVNNAGVPSRVDFLESTAEELERVLGINLKGPLYFCKHAIPVMRAAGGAIVNVASISATCGIPNQTLYAPTKAGVLQLTRQLAVQYAPDQIRVNAVSPGVIDTPMLRIPAPDPAAQALRFEALRVRHPLGRFGLPAEVAAAILFLASDEAAFITGANLAVDGGYAAQ